MKIEPRGKYAGVKVHLDGEEAEMFLDFVGGAPTPIGANKAVKFASKLGEKIRKLQFEVPTLLKERTEEEVKAALLKDQKKIEEQLKAIETGGDWRF